MGLVKSPSTTILTLQVACLQHMSNPYKPSTSKLKYSAILNNTLTNLMVLNPKKDFLAQAIVTYNNLVSHLHIIYYLTGTDFTQNLVPQQEVVVAALAKTAFKEQSFKLLVNLI